MRLCSSLSLCLAAAAVLVPVTSVGARADAASSCAGADDRNFPLSARIRGGPQSYTAGGVFGIWYIDLTNTTDRSCADIHPVVVLVDDKRALTVSQPHLEFYDGSRARPVHFEATDEHELVGAFEGGGFGGFTVAPGKTVSVKVRLAVTSDAVANEITANAAVVQRHGADGDWVGESNDYRFRIASEGGGADGSATATPEHPGSPSPSASPRSSPAGTGTPTSSTSAVTSTLAPDASPAPTATGPSFPFADEAAGAAERAEELAATGLAVAHGAAAVAVALLAAGVSAYVVRRRRR